jgi:ATP-dependent DNA helicase RecG
MSEKEDLEHLRRVLLPPLRFASADAHARLDRLRGLEGLVRGALQGVSDDFPAPLARAMQEAARGFDGLSAAQKKARLKSLGALLKGETTFLPNGPSPEPDPIDAEGENALARRSPMGPGVHAFLLDADVTVLRGVGKRARERLAERGIEKVGALLEVWPRTWEDRRRVTPLKDLESGVGAVVRGEVKASGKVGGGRGARFEAIIDDDTATFKLVFFHFNERDLKRRLEVGQWITAVGDVNRYGPALQMVHPRIEKGNAEGKLIGIKPVYPELRGMPEWEIHRHVQSAVEHLKESAFEDPLPHDVVKKANLLNLKEALIAVHQPPSDMSDGEFRALLQGRSPAQKRLAFDALFAFQVAMAQRHHQTSAKKAPLLSPEDPSVLWAELLPFNATEAQARVCREICADLQSGHSMLRLLQGDVGAGKTAVAAVAALSAVRAHRQVALMAPTEILAEQHHHTLGKLFEKLGEKVVFFSGSLKKAARRANAELLASGEARIAVGTHALLSDDVVFQSLGLCVVDEQHRFGVEQRTRLLAKANPGEVADGLFPHLLVMTATPIPRSLALTAYGDLDVSVIDELPPGRHPVKTEVFDIGDKAAMHSALKEVLKRNERAYVVFPLIEASEKLDLENATLGHTELSRAFGEDHVGLVHGRMSPADKDAVVAAFKAGQKKILVSTTVVEVGVDVPEATCIVIMHAERFGLSQLHQLRGRVGRSPRKSRALLMAGDGAHGEDARQRLEVMVASQDGFEIAAADLELRGPGELLGTRQSGESGILFAHLARHGDLVAQARALARQVVGDDPGLQAQSHGPLKRMLAARFGSGLQRLQSG